MLSTNPKPKWWQLYLVLPLLIALFAGDHRLRTSATGHEAVQIGIVLLVYLLIHLWLKENAGALSGMDRAKSYGGVRVIRFYSSQVPEPDRESGPLLQLPDSEIKGMLGDTFEMDYIDAVPYAEEDVIQESKKD